MMKLNFRGILIFLLTAFLFLCPGIGVSGQEATDAYSPEELQEDFALFRSVLEQVHGGFARYSSEEDMTALFEKARVRLNAPGTERQFYGILAPLIGAINDGHTGIDPSRRFDRRLTRARIFFPLRLRFLSGRAYVVENLTPTKILENGAEILSINGASISDLLAVFLPSISSDAHVETSKLRKLGSTEYFCGLYALLVEEVDSFKITFRNPGVTEVGSTIFAGLDQRRFARAERDHGTPRPSPKPPIEFAMRNGIGELTVRTFGSGAYSAIPYREFLKDTFATLNQEGAEDLLIDLRGNGGGSDEYGKLLFAHLTEERFSYYRWLEVRSDRFDFLEKEGIKDPLPDSSRLKKNERGRFDLSGHPNSGIQSPVRPTFRGRVTILVDGGSFSATSEFTSIAHFHKRATFVGVESGGGYYGNTSGSSLRFSLPNTKLRVRVPLVRYTMAVEGYPKDRGLVPDHAISPTIEDVLAGKDTQLEYARKLIESSRGE